MHTFENINNHKKYYINMIQDHNGHFVIHTVKNININKSTNGRSEKTVNLSIEIVSVKNGHQSKWFLDGNAPFFISLNRCTVSLALCHRIRFDEFFFSFVLQFRKHTRCYHLPTNERKWIEHNQNIRIHFKQRSITNENKIISKRI